MKPVTIVEVIVIYISVGWGLVLITQHGIFAMSENFNKIEMIVRDERILGAVCLLVALVKIVGLIMKKDKIRQIGLLASSVLWVLISASFVVARGSVEFNTGFVVYSGIAVMCLWASKEVRGSDGNNKRGSR